MSDKPRTQQQLARDLADLVDALRSKSNMMGFIGAFWQTMAREWGSIDGLRMDKYLYLVRCYVNKGFEKVAKDQWADQALLEVYSKIMVDVPLNARDIKIPNGLRYHVVDIYVDELDKVDVRRTAPLEIMLQPLRQLATDTPTKAMRKRVQEALDDERLNHWLGADDLNGEEADGAGQSANGGEEEFGGFDD